MLKENLREVEGRVEAACKRAGRDVSEVTLIAVSKTKPVEDLQEIYDAGKRDFGENKVQELCAKMEVMPQDIKWHMIGHLQRNKVKYIVGNVALIHSVDSFRLAEEITREDAMELVRQIATLDAIEIKGLMTIAPYVVDAEENRPYFRKIKELSVDIAKQNIDNVSMDILSMGMTGDFEVAIEEGATMVRVGTGIFGKRNYQNT